MADPGYITRNGKRIDFVVAGAPDGIPLLFVPGSFSTPVAWRAIQSALGAGYRFHATSILGYGGTEETRSKHDCHIDREVEVIEAVGREIARPVHLVGHSFGATVALAAAMQHRIDTLSVTTFEANPISLLASAHPELFAEAAATGGAIRQACEAGDRDAPAVVIELLGRHWRLRRASRRCARLLPRDGTCKYARLDDGTKSHRRQRQPGGV